jgi:hypothetical protein
MPKKSDDDSHKKEKPPNEEKERLTSADMPDIDWTKKDFPPCINLISFNLETLPGRLRPFCQKLWWGVLILILYWVLNIISCLFHFCCSSNSAWRIIFSLALMPIVIIISFITFA